MSDRRRVNGPPGGTTPPVFTSSKTLTSASQAHRQNRAREPDELRKIFLKTGLTPSASGSAYLELDRSVGFDAGKTSFIDRRPGVKLSCTVHGPRPLHRSAPFTPHLSLSTFVKFAPFATRQRRGYIRDASERDLAAHVENALRGVIIGERLPKSGLEITITVLEGEEDNPWGNEEARVGEQKSQAGGWGMMSVLSGCITIASAALADAGIDCVDLICGGMAAIVHQPALANTNQRQNPPSGKKTGSNTSLELVLDPCPIEHREITAACVVGYLQSRDEITEIWVKGAGGDLRPSSKQNSGRFTIDLLMDRAVEASMATRLVLVAAINESTELKLKI